MTGRKQDARIRVMQVVTRLNIGGPARLVTLAAQGLEERGFETLLVSGRLSQGEGGMYDEALSRGLEMEILPELQRSLSPLADSIALAKLTALVRSFRPHIIHTHLSKAGLLGRVAGLASGPAGIGLPGPVSLAAPLARLGGVRPPKLVHTFHGHVFSGYFGRTMTAAFLETERLLGRFTAKLVALSESQKQELSHRYRLAPEDRFAVIPLGLEHLDRLWEAAESRALRSDFRRELGLKDSDLLLGTVGRMVPIKNHALLLDAFARLVGRMPRLHLVIVGDGQLRDRAEARAARPDLAGRVHFLGWRRDLERIYAGLDLFVLSSKNEGTPVAVIEALAAGLPVVATAVGGVVDLLDQGRLGHLVPPGDPEALADSLAEAVGAALGNTRSWPESDVSGRSTTARTMVMDAESRSRWVRERYSAQRFVSNLVSLYNGILEG